MKKLMTRKPAAASTSTKPEAPANENTAPVQKIAPSTSSTTPEYSYNTSLNNSQGKLKEIQKKAGGKFSVEDVQREYELSGNDEKKTLISLMKQKEEEEAIVKRNLFKRMEEVNNVKTVDTVEMLPSTKSYFLELLEVLCADPKQSRNVKTVKLAHPMLKVIKENFAKPSPDHLVHISRND